MKTKQVFPTQEIAHLWANQRQISARNSGGNFSYGGRTIWSYSTVQAELKKDDHNTVFIVDYNYSNTTSKHVYLIRNATSHKKQVFVHYPEKVELYSENFWCNIEHFKSNALSHLEEASKPRKQAKTRIKEKESAVYELSRIVNLLEVFDITIDKLKNKSNLIGKYTEKANFDYLIKLVKERDNILSTETDFLKEYNQQKEKAKKQKEKLAAKALKLRIEEQKERLKEWLKGSNKYTSYDLRYITTVYLRAIPKADSTEVQTSQGATVPYKEAKLLYKSLMAGKTNMLGKEIGGYKILELTRNFLDENGKTDSSIKIGCHILLFSEIERFAKTQKW